MWFGTAMLTEGPAAVLGMLALVCTPLFGRTGRRYLVACGLVLVVLAFTRQAAVIPAAGITAAWIGTSIRHRRISNDWLPFAIVASVAAVGSQLLQTLIWPGFSVFSYYQTKTGTDRLSASIAEVPSVAWNIVGRDFDVMWGRDRALLLFIVLTVVAIVATIRTVEAQVALGALAAGAALNVLNTTPTVFRYFFPAYFFMMVAIAGWLSTLSRSNDEADQVPRQDDDDMALGESEPAVHDAVQTLADGEPSSVGVEAVGSIESE